MSHLINIHIICENGKEKEGYEFDYCNFSLLNLLYSVIVYSIQTWTWTNHNPIKT